MKRMTHEYGIQLKNDMIMGHVTHTPHTQTYMVLYSNCDTYNNFQNKKQKKEEKWFT